MSNAENSGQTKSLVLEYVLDASPEKVWCAISIPDFREKWLPNQDLTVAEPMVANPGEEVRYRMRETEPPFLESLVIFQIKPDANGGTILRIFHGLVAPRLPTSTPQAANNNGLIMMLAA
jgi:uncharacterized protein YndB with AHSA1/START domain